jgi:hypothetical protein
VRLGVGEAPLVTFIGYVATTGASAIAPAHSRRLDVSVALFTAAQVFRMPSWRSAMFPALGARTLGVVDGLLFLAVPTILPLIVAHIVFFLVATL